MNIKIGQDHKDPAHHMRAASEIELQSKLNLPRILRSSDETEGGITDCVVRMCEVRMVERVEEVSSELHPEPLGEGEVLLQD